MIQQISLIIMSKPAHPGEILKRIQASNQPQDSSEVRIFNNIHIPYADVMMVIKEYFPALADDMQGGAIGLDNNFNALFRKLIESYHNLAVHLKNSIKLEGGSNIGADLHQKLQTPELQGRKNTRATFAMRHSKNQQELKKDQIFVRMIPRTQNCIHFMVKNHNFPRIECKLSCNQHLEYLINYLTNKWLRGKVGVGYQIRLYPDPSTYMHRHSNEPKRPNIIHEPLNNYLMFTDIMAAFGVAQNGCINLLYDFTELRKEKLKLMGEKEGDRILEESLNSNQRAPQGNRYDLVAREALLQSGKKKSQKQSPSKPEISKLFKASQDHKHQQYHNDEHSLAFHKDKKNINHNSINYSEANSLGFQFNHYNSNVFGHLFDFNSNGFPQGLESQKPIAEHPADNKSKPQNSSNNFVQAQSDSKTIKSSPVQVQGQAENNNLDHIRQYISMVEKETQGADAKKEQASEVNELMTINEKEENSMHRSENNFKKEVKIIPIIKKKNPNQ